MPARVAAAEGLFRSDLRLSEFVRLFAPHNAELVRNKKERFVSYLNQARAGTMLDRPAGYVPAWRAHVRTEEPMFNRLQSSNDDCSHGVMST